MVDPLNLAYLFPTVHTHPNPPTRPTHQDERQKKVSSSSKRPNWISIRKREVSQSLRASRSTGVLKGSGRLMLGSVFISLSLFLSFGVLGVLGITCFYGSSPIWVDPGI